MSEIGSQSTRIATFVSSEISALLENDRKLINTYWGQNVSTILYAERLYQKLIYDRLSTIASEKLDG